MVTLSGTHTSTGVDYYTRDSVYVDLSTVGFEPGSELTIVMTCTGGIGTTEQMGWDVSLQPPDPDTTKCFHWTPVTPTGGINDPVTYGPAVVGSTVEWTGTAGATGDQTYTRLNMTAFTYTYPDLRNPTWTWSITYTPGGPPTVCAYGTEKKNDADTVVELGIGTVSQYLPRDGRWATARILALIAGPILVDQLCAMQPPPGDQTWNPTDWVTFPAGGPISIGEQKIIDKFKATMWNGLCQCKPAPAGQPPPVGPVTVIWTQPTSYTTYNNNTISETSLSIAINTLYTLSTSNNQQITNVTNLVQQLAACACPGAYTFGATLTGLTGTGSFPIGGAVGLLIQVTERPTSTRVLEGDPPYLWDIGWVSLSTADGMLDEKRITRTTMVWLPPWAKLATTFGYYAWPGVELSITELMPASS